MILIFFGLMVFYIFGSLAFYLFGLGTQLKRAYSKSLITSFVFGPQHENNGSGYFNVKTSPPWPFLAKMTTQGRKKNFIRLRSRQQPKGSRKRFFYLILPTFFFLMFGPLFDHLLWSCPVQQGVCYIYSRFSKIFTARGVSSRDPTRV